MEKHHALRYGANSYPPGQECHGSTPRCVVWPTSDGASLPARRLRPPTAWWHRMPDPEEVNHWGCLPSPNDLVFPSFQGVGEDWSQASSPVDRVAHPISRDFGGSGWVTVGMPTRKPVFSPPLRSRGLSRCESTERTRNSVQVRF